MLVECNFNELSGLSEKVRSRLAISIQLESLSEYFKTGDRFEVQAIERIQGGTWIYLHNKENWPHYPHPHPAEFFSIIDPKIPENWTIKWGIEEGSIKIKRMTFKEWVEDDYFFEKLMDGDSVALEAYKNNRK